MPNAYHAAIGTGQADRDGMGGQGGVFGLLEGEEQEVGKSQQDDRLEQGQEAKMSERNYSPSLFTCKIDRHEYPTRHLKT